MTPICRIRNGEQVSHSSRSGVRFCGGRHFTMLAMYTCSRFSPMAAIMLFSNWPARPTKGRPCCVFVRARTFADEHQLGMRIAGAEDDLLAALARQLAAIAVRADVVENDAEQRFAIAAVA